MANDGSVELSAIGVEAREEAEEAEYPRNEGGDGGNAYVLHAVGATVAPLE